MTSLLNKPRAGSAWLPNQVAYGIDCSDEDPKKWTAFGTEVDKQAAKHASVKPSSATLPDPQQR